MKQTFKENKVKKQDTFYLVKKKIFNLMLGNNLKVHVLCSLSIGRKASQSSKRYLNIS